LSTRRRERNAQPGASRGDVTHECYRSGCSTIPIAFATVSPDCLVPGRYYHAKPVK
jgi:hypothetical protein